MDCGSCALTIEDGLRQLPGALRVSVDFTTETLTIEGAVSRESVAQRVRQLGYRLAEKVTGRGVATQTVRELAGQCADRYGLHTLRAQTTQGNVASQRVLLKAGFTPTGPTTIKGLPATWYELDVSGG